MIYIIMSIISILILFSMNIANAIVPKKDIIYKYVTYDKNHEKEYLIRTAITSLNQYFDIYKINVRLVDIHKVDHAPNISITFTNILNEGRIGGITKFDRFNDGTNTIYIALKYKHTVYEKGLMHDKIDNISDTGLINIIRHELIHAITNNPNHVNDISALMYAKPSINNLLLLTNSDIKFIKNSLKP